MERANLVRMEVKIEQNTKSRLDKYCRENGHTMTGLVNKILGMFLDERAKQKARGKESLSVDRH